MVRGYGTSKYTTDCNGAAMREWEAPSNNATELESKGVFDEYRPNGLQYIDHETHSNSFIDIDGHLDDLLEGNILVIERCLQKQIDDQIEESMKKQWDEQMTAYFSRSHVDHADFDDCYQERPREIHQSIPSFMATNTVGELSPTVADVNRKIQTVVDEYHRTEVLKTQNLQKPAVLDNT